MLQVAHTAAGPVDDRDWRLRLGLLLTPRPDDGRPRSIAVVGMGNTQRGDDGAGIWVARYLLRHVQTPGWQVFNVATAPESFVGKLVLIRPDTILFIDAIVAPDPPGTIRWVDGVEFDGFGTHATSLGPTLAYLTATCGARIGVLGIAIAGDTFGASLSVPVRRALRQVARALRTCADAEKAPMPNRAPAATIRPDGVDDARTCSD
jgi:hydrogenase maturation protease